ncbi:MAG: TOBE domain-containing protein, partial [Pararhizobium sp.]
EHLGSDTFLHIHVEGIGLVTARVSGDFGVNHGDQVFLTPDEGRVHKFNDKGLAIR